jgi:hypothetical protein
MAVGDDLLGQPVRCPHCQQVVHAPSAPAAVAAMPPPEAPAPAGTIEPPPIVDLAFTLPKDEDSIFGPTPIFTDDLFGEISERPTVEIPMDAPWPPASAHAEAPIPDEVETLPLPPAAADLAFVVPPDPEAPPDGQAPAVWQEPWRAPLAPVATGALGTEQPAEADEFLGAAAEALPSAEAPPSYQPATRPAGGNFAGLTLLIFLIPYAIFVTLAAAYLYFQLKRLPDPLELLPDQPGDNPGATHKGPTVSERFPPDRRLPARLHVPLGQTIDIGDLRVTPLKIEQRRVVFCSEGAGTTPEPSQDDALVLTLRLKNISRDVYFVPTDAAFSSRWKEGDPVTSRPYTFLEVGAKRFYGGPFRWKPRGQSEGYRDPDPREYIQGQENDGKVLKPGQERLAVLCTDPEQQAIIAAVKRSSGRLVWRVQLRRGLVSTGDREVAVAAVIGVDFRAADVH